MATYIADLRSTSGWTERWNTGAASVAVTTDGFRITQTASDFYALTWNSIDTDADRADVEVLTKLRFMTSQAGQIQLGVLCRASGATGSEEALAVLISQEDALGINPYLREYVAGPLNASGFSYVTGSSAPATWYWLRARANSTMLSVKCWEDGNAEPAAWDKEKTFTSVTSAGWVGVIPWNGAADPHDIGYFSVGTNGDTAPSGGGTSGALFLGVDF